MGAFAVFLGDLFLVFCFFPSSAFFRFSRSCRRGEKLSFPLHRLISPLSSLAARATHTHALSLFVFPTTLFFRHETTALLFSHQPEHKPTDIYKNTMTFAALSTVRVVASVSRRRRFFSLGFFVLSLSLSRARMREPSSELITDTFSIHFEY